MSGLPPSVSAAVKNLTDDDPKETDVAWAAGSERIALVNALVAAGSPERDIGEPSWELLGRFIEDVTFVHAYRRLKFFAAGLGFPFDSYQAEFQKAVALVNEHPYAGVIRSIPLERRANNPKLQQLYDSMRLVDLDFWAYDYANKVINLKPPKTNSTLGRNMTSTIVGRADHIAQDEEMAGYSTSDVKVNRRLQSISPHSPQAIAQLIGHDSKLDQAQLKQWEEDYGKYGNVLLALAARCYEERKQLDDAENLPAS